jgi:hypothetical protein
MRPMRPTGRPVRVAPHLVSGLKTRSPRGRQRFVGFESGNESGNGRSTMKRNAAWLDPLQHHKQLMQALEATRFEFVLVELDLASTFCEIAVSAPDRMRAARNAENARRAYQAAVRFLDHATFPPEMTKEIIKRITELKPVLQELDALHAAPISSLDRSAALPIALPATLP